MTRTIKTDASSKVSLSVVTHLTDAEACAILVEKKFDNSFAMTLVGKFRKYGSLYTNQLAWLHKLALECVEAPKSEQKEESKPEPKPIIKFTNIVAFLTPVSQKLKSGANVEFNIDGFTVGVKRAGAGSKTPGSFWVTDGRPYGQSTVYGRIAPDGEWVTMGHNTQAKQTAEVILGEFDADPKGYCATNGIRTGRCCFCRRPLEDETSVKFGYGPACAKAYDLPHGAKALAKAEKAIPVCTKPEPMVVEPAQLEFDFDELMKNVVY